MSVVLVHGRGGRNRFDRSSLGLSRHLTFYVKSHNNGRTLFFQFLHKTLDERLCLLNPLTMKLRLILGLILLFGTQSAHGWLFGGRNNFWTAIIAALTSFWQGGVLDPFGLDSDAVDGCPDMKADAACSREWLPVVCNNECDYSNACEAQAAGFDVDSNCEPR